MGDVGCGEADDAELVETFFGRLVASYGVKDGDNVNRLVLLPQGNTSLVNHSMGEAPELAAIEDVGAGLDRLRGHDAGTDDVLLSGFRDGRECDGGGHRSV